MIRKLLSGGLFLLGVALASQVLAVTTAYRDAEKLLGGIGLAVKTSHSRCETFFPQMERLDALHSVHRENIARYSVLVDGHEILQSGRDPLETIVYERWSGSPDRISIAAGYGKWRSRAKLVEGMPMEVYFVDKRGQHHPTFCGRLLRVDAGSSRSSIIYAYSEQPDRLVRTVRRFQEMTDRNIIENVAAERGLPVDDQTTLTSPVRSIVDQRVPDWVFLQQRATAAQLSLRLLDGRILLRNGTPARGEPVYTRSYTDMTDADAAESLANDLGLSTETRLTATLPIQNSIRQRAEPNETFWHRLGARNAASVYLHGNTLMFVEGEGMRRAPNVSPYAVRTRTRLTTVPMVGLVERIGIKWQRGNARYQRSYSGLSTPSSTTAWATTMLTQPSTRNPSVELQSATPSSRVSATSTTKRLDQVIAALRLRAGGDAGTAMLLEIARQYRSSLLYLHRYRRGGLSSLDAVLSSK